MELDEQLYDTWNINNRVNLYLLEAIAADLLAEKLAKGRSVGEMFAHIHNVRLQWLEPAPPQLMLGLSKVEKASANDKQALYEALEASGKAMEELLRVAVANGGKVKGFAAHVTAFLGYMIAHDAHHRAEASFILSQNGHALSNQVAYDIWNWSKR